VNESFIKTTRLVAENGLYLPPGGTGGGGGGITQLTGDVLAGPGAGSQAATVVRINGATVPAAGALTPGDVLTVTGASALGYAPPVTTGITQLTGNVLAGPGTGIQSARTADIILPAANANVIVTAFQTTVVVTALTATHSATLPVTPTTGQRVTLVDGDGSLTNFNFEIIGNGKTINGLADFFIAAGTIGSSAGGGVGPRGAITFLYDGTQWWAVYGDLASRPSLDFIVDCGADPTNTSDCVPALNKAYSILSALAVNPELPKQTCELLIPPGAYAILSNPTTWIFNPPNSPTRLIIRGYGDASILVCNVGSGGADVMLTISNVRYVDIRDLAVVGGQSNTVTPDCDFCFNIQGGDSCEMSHCRILGVHATSAVIEMDMRRNILTRCDISGCLSDDATKGIILAFQTIDMTDCQMQDLPTLNGWSTSNTQKGLTNATYLVANLAPSVPPAFPVINVSVNRCFFSSDCKQAIIVNGDPTNKVPLVEFIDVSLSIPGSKTPGLPNVLITNADHVDVRGFYYTNTAGGAKFPALALESVGSALLDLRLDPNTANTCNYVTADSACGLVEFVGGTQSVSLMQTLAAQTTVKSPLVANDLASIGDIQNSGAALTSFQVVKPTSGGVVPVATTDRASKASGITLDVASGAGVPVRVARSGQPVTVTNDGAAVISVGDLITVSATTAGQVTHTTTAGIPILGTALTGAAATPGALFTIQFDPSVV
jgi:hypothetical protein